MAVEPVRAIGCIKGYLDATTSVSTNLYLSMLWKMSPKCPCAPDGENLAMPDYDDVGGSMMMCKNTQVRRGVPRQGLGHVFFVGDTLNRRAHIHILSSMFLSATTALFS